MGVGAESREFSTERNDFGEGGGAVGVGVVTALGGFHHVAAAPEVVEGVVHGDLGDAVFVGEFDGAVDGAVGDRLAEFFVRVPALGGGEAGRQEFDFRAGNAAADAGAEEVVEVQGLERVVGADAVTGRLGAEFGAFRGFVGAVAVGLIGFGDEGVVVLAWNDEEFGHRLEIVEKPGNHADIRARVESHKARYFQCMAGGLKIDRLAADTEDAGDCIL